MIFRHRRNTSVVWRNSALIVVPVYYLSSLVTQSLPFLNPGLVVADPGTAYILPVTFTRRNYCSTFIVRNSMTCRPPIIPTTTTSPITTTYRRRILAAFAQAQQEKLDSDSAELIETRDKGNHDTGGLEHIERDEEEYRFLKQVSTLSSSPQRLCYVSAMAQCCTIQQIYALRDNYNDGAKQLHTIMSNPTLDGNVKHQMHCRHRYNYGRQPFVCKDCWSYLPICMCHKQQYQQQEVQGPNTDNGNGNTNLNNDDLIFQRVPRLPLPPTQHSSLTANGNRSTINGFDKIDVIMWTHHKEWGSPSNTGSVFVAALKQLHSRNDAEFHVASCNLQAYMLMKGYNEHDDQFECLLRPQNDAEKVIPVVLWAPAAEDNTSNTSSPSTADTAETELKVDSDDCEIKSYQEPATSSTPKRKFVSVDELLDDLHKITAANTSLDENGDNETTQKHMTIRIVMIAVEGTWNQAKRMVTKLPHQVRALHLSDMELYHWRTLLPSSLFNNINMERSQNDDQNEQVQISGTVSILAPLRKQKTIPVNRNASKIEKQSENMGIGNDSNSDGTEAAGVVSKVINTNKVCTVEAVVSALVALSAIPIPDGDYIINLADQKVIRTVTYQGKMTLRNIISHW